MSVFLAADPGVMHCCRVSGIVARVLLAGLRLIWFCVFVVNAKRGDSRGLKRVSEKWVYQPRGFIEVYILVFLDCSGIDPRFYKDGSISGRAHSRDTRLIFRALLVSGALFAH